MRVTAVKDAVTIETYSITAELTFSAKISNYMVLFTSGLDGRSLQLFIDTVCKDFIEVLVMSRSEYRRHSPPVRDLFGNSASFESDDSMAGFSFLQWKEHEIKFNARYQLSHCLYTLYSIYH